MVCLPQTGNNRRRCLVIEQLKVRNAGRDMMPLGVLAEKGVYIGAE
jgi:hypothetical protein